MKNRVDDALTRIARANGYKDVDALLMDYRFLPTVLTPMHRKIEIIRLLLKSKKK